MAERSSRVHSFGGVFPGVSGTGPGPCPAGAAVRSCPCAGQCRHWGASDELRRRGELLSVLLAWDFWGDNNVWSGEKRLPLGRLMRFFLPCWSRGLTRPVSLSSRFPVARCWRSSPRLRCLRRGRTEEQPLTGSQEPPGSRQSAVVPHTRTKPCLR